MPVVSEEILRREYEESVTERGPSRGHPIAEFRWSSLGSFLMAVGGIAYIVIEGCLVFNATKDLNMITTLGRAAFIGLATFIIGAIVAVWFVRVEHR